LRPVAEKNPIRPVINPYEVTSLHPRGRPQNRCARAIGCSETPKSTRGRNRGTMFIVRAAINAQEHIRASVMAFRGYGEIKRLRVGRSMGNDARARSPEVWRGESKIPKSDLVRDVEPAGLLKTASCLGHPKVMRRRLHQSEVGGEDRGSGVASSRIHPRIAALGHC